MSCLTTDVLARLEAGLLDERAAASAFAHLGGCRSCQEFHREFFATAHALAALPQDVLEAKPRPDAWARIATRMNEPGPAAELPLAPGSVSIACTYCKDRLARREAVYCAGCLAPHHGGCWEEHGRCAACAVGELVRASASPDPAPAPRRRRTLGGLLVLGAVGVSGAAAFTAGRGSRPGPVAVASPSRESFQSTFLDPNEINKVLEGGSASKPSGKPVLVAALTSHDQALALAARVPGELDPDELTVVVEDAEACLARGAKPPVSSAWLLEATQTSAAAELGIKLDPENPEWWCRAAESSSIADKTALSRYERALALDPRSLAAHLGRAWTQRRLERPKEAEPDLAFVIGAVTTRSPTHDRVIAAEALDCRALGARERGDVALALADLERAVAITPEADPHGRARFLELRARIQLEHRDLAGAQADVERAIALAPGDPSFLPTRLAVDFEKRDFDRVLEGAQTLHALSSSYPSAFWAGRALAWKLDEAGALAALAGQDSTNERGEILALGADRVRVLDEVTRRSPRATLGDLVAEAGAERARREAAAMAALHDNSIGLVRLLLAKRDVARAKAILEHHYATSPDPQALLLWGEVALHEKDWELAAARFESVLAVDSQSAGATAGLATAFHSRGATQEARSLFAKARSLEAREGKETEETYFWTVGLEHARRAARFLDADESGKAIRALTRVLRLNPRHALAHLERARLFRAFRSWDLAVEEAQAAADADPYFAAPHELLWLLEEHDLPCAPDPRTQRPRALRSSRSSQGERASAEALAAANPAQVLDAVLGYGDLSRAAAQKLLATLPQGLDEVADVTTGSAPALVERTLRILGPAARRQNEVARGGSGGVVARDVPSAERAVAAREALECSRRRARLLGRARAGARSLLERARAREGEHRDEDALELLERALLLDGGLAGARLERAVVLARLGHGSAALRDLAAGLEASVRTGDRVPTLGVLEALGDVVPFLEDEAIGAVLDGKVEGSPFEEDARRARAFRALVRARRGAPRAATEAALAELASVPEWGSLLKRALEDLLRLALGEASSAEALEAELAGGHSRSSDVLALLALARRPGEDAAKRAMALELAAAGVAEQVPGASWERLRRLPELAPLGDDARLAAWFARRAEVDAATARAPGVLSLGGGDMSRLPGHSFAEGSWEHASPVGRSLEVLARQEALFLPARGFPTTPAALEAYDLVRLNVLELPAEVAFTGSASFLGDALVPAVRAGLGLVVEVDPGDSRSAERLEALLASPLGAILPVSRPEGEGASCVHLTAAARDLETAAGLEGPLGAVFEHAWHLVPAPVSGSARVTEPRPGATVLLGGASGPPLLVAGRAGKGRVLVSLSKDLAPVELEHLLWAARRP